MQDLITVILASGEGTGINSSMTRATTKICGQSILSYVAEAGAQSGADKLVLVAGKESAEPAPDGMLYILQEDPPDFSKDILKVEDILHKNEDGTVLILFGDMPLVSGQTLKKAYDFHSNGCNKGTVLSSKTNKLSGNVYYFNIKTFLMIFTQLKNNKGKFNADDILRKMSEDGLKTGDFDVQDSSELLRVSDLITMEQAERALLKRIIRKHMQNGVAFHLPDTCLIHSKVQIGKGTVILPGTQLEGSTIIGENCEIGPFSRIEDGIVGNGVKIMNSVMTQSQVGDNTRVGPFAYIRPGSKIGRNIKIGDFVEIKNSVIGENTKIPHLSYIGDADIGQSVNVGCGAVVVNYDGKKKHRTFVGDHAFVGCNVNLVSPVEIKNYAYIAAGSTITSEVPEYALAIARNRQTVIEDWVKKKGLDIK